MTSAEKIHPSLPAEEYRHRTTRLHTMMTEERLDALLVYGNVGQEYANVYYLTGYNTGDYCYVLIIPGQEPQLFVSDDLYLEYAQESSRYGSVGVLSRDPGQFLGEILRNSGVATGTVGFATAAPFVTDQNLLPHDHFADLVAALPSATFVNATPIMPELRLVKSRAEIELLRHGAELTDEVVRAMATAAKPGMTDHDLARAIYNQGMMRGGEQRLVFIGSTSMSRPEIVFPRQNPGRRIIGNGDIVLSELSTSFDGYPGQIHRPMVFGEPTPEYQRLFNISRDAFYKVLEVLKPGNSNHDVSAAAGSIFEPAGVYTQDVLIHGWGLSLENPLLDYTPRALIANEQQSLVFEPGMTFVLQPHVLSEDRQRGLQIGSSVVITDDGAEVLQKYPIEWITIAG